MDGGGTESVQATVSDVNGAIPLNSGENVDENEGINGLKRTAPDPDNTADLPPPKAPRADGSLEKVPPRIIAAASDVEAWIAARRKNWPTQQRILAKQEALKVGKIDRPEGNTDGPETRPDTKKPRVSVCKYFARGRCRNGANCRFAHIAGADRSGDREHHREHGDKTNFQRVYKRFEAPRASSLFLKLVQSDHDVEDQKVLSYIRALAGQGLLEP